MPQTDYQHPNETPILLLLALSIFLCIWTFWIGTVCVRAWFYKGALDPEFEKFIIIPKYRKKRAQRLAAGNTHAHAQSHAIAARERATVFPHVASGTETVNPFTDTAFPVASDEAAGLGVRIVENSDAEVNNEREEEATMKYLAEERRICRLPAFEQDDCGDGSQFPGVLVAMKPTPKARRPIQTSALQRTKDYLALGLKMVDEREWLVVGDGYFEMWEVRMRLLSEKAAECVVVSDKGEAPCEELMEHVVDALVRKYPGYFSVRRNNGKKGIRCVLTGEEYDLAKLHDLRPIEVCARLCVDDFTVFVRDDFTRIWYLQGSATCFPSGYRISKFIGRSLMSILNDGLDPMIMWEDLPQILDIAQSSPANLFRRTTKSVQTRPPGQPLTSALHISRPMDFFAGNTNDLQPSILTIRCETQTFKVLPKTGTVVMTTKTDLKRLSELDGTERAELMMEIKGWDEEEAIFKGRDLWIRAVSGWCTGHPGMKDDESIINAGALTSIGG